MCLYVCVCVCRARENERKSGEWEGLMEREKGESKQRGTPSCRFGGGLQDNLKADSKQRDFPPPFFVYIIFKCCLEQTKLETNEPTNSQTHTVKNQLSTKGRGLDGPSGLQPPLSALISGVLCFCICGSFFFPSLVSKTQSFS